MTDFFSRLLSSPSHEESLINDLFVRYLWFAVFIVVLIAGAILLAAFRFRETRRRGEPTQIAGNTLLETAWTVFPFVVVVYFFILALEVMSDINRPVPEGARPDVDIIAHQWWWEIHYPASGVVTANELHIPTGHRVLMKVSSADVVHDWWVPALGRKIDAVPGHPNFRWIQADSAGLYTGTCSEYCGAQHAWMRIRVIAEGQPSFDRWLKSQEDPPVTPTDSLSRVGAHLFQLKACSACHTIAGTPATGMIGPDLSHLASRSTILSGRFPNTSDTLREFLTNPERVKPGVHMPNFLLSPAEVNALVKYLGALR